MTPPVHEFRNWMGNQRCRAPLARPTSLEELRATVGRLARRGPLRVVGRGRSWSPLVPTDGALLSLDALDRVLDEDLAGPAPTVRVECGATVLALTERLYQRGFSLIGPTMYRDVALGGALATGSHGFDQRSGTLADSVVSLTLIDARGDVHELDASSGDLFDAARVSLGALGVVYAARLRVEPTRALQVDEHRFGLEVFLRDIPDVLATYEQVQVFWFPPSGHVHVRGMNRLDAPPPPETRWERAAREAGGRWLHGLGSTMQPLVSRFAPGLVTSMMKSAEWVNGQRRSWTGRPEAEYHYRERAPRCWSMSAAVPSASAEEAWRVVMESVARRRRETGLESTFPVYARFVGASRALLAPSHDRPTCFIESVQCLGTRRREAYFEALERAIAALPAARMHWGKLVMDPDWLPARYPAMERFRAVRARLDPGGVFMNPWVARALGEPPRG